MKRLIWAVQPLQRIGLLEGASEAGLGKGQQAAREPSWAAEAAAVQAAVQEADLTALQEADLAAVQQADLATAQHAGAAAAQEAGPVAAREACLAAEQEADGAVQGTRALLKKRPGVVQSYQVASCG